MNTRNVNKLEVAWSYETGDEMSYTFCPLVVDNIAYVAAKQGALVALDATTGKELWVYTVSGRADVSAESRASAEPTTGKARTAPTGASS